MAVIGDFPHHRDDQGRIWGLEPVVAQLDCWGDRFDRMVLCGPVLPGPPPSGFAPYRTPGVDIVELARAGGNTPLAKLGLLPRIPGWAWRTRRVARSVDAVHLRCPCNIGLVAIFSTRRAARYRYAIYAGVWRSYRGEPRAFGLQRRLLASRWFGGPVSVYAAPDPDRPHLEPFFSPSFDHADWQAAAPDVARKRADLIERDAAGPWRFVVVGRLTPNKNQQAAIRAVADLVEGGLDASLEVLGDGPMEGELRDLAANLGIGDRVRFHGMVDLATVNRTFAESDLQILSTRQEGYGKVLLEGMVHGVVPLFTSSPPAPVIAGDGSRGILIDPEQPRSIADAARSLIDDRPRWVAMVDDARAFTETCTLEAFGAAVHDVLERGWGVDLPVRRRS
ncbi:MAG: glycosyltransferase family 4 protein [Acidimicrobiales bacterium]|nr:glycosyltransferase family 4 protein [Acidimicrobiales bacterium]